MITRRLSGDSILQILVSHPDADGELRVFGQFSL